MSQEVRWTSRRADRMQSFARDLPENTDPAVQLRDANFERGPSLDYLKT